MADEHELPMTDADSTDADSTDGDSTDADSIKTWIVGWGAEVASADVARGRKRFAPDLSAFGTHTAVMRGRDVVEAEQWSQIWSRIEDFQFAADDLEVMISPDRLLAVVAVAWSSTGIDRDGQRFPRPGRATVVLRRDTLESSWSGVHTHFSLVPGVPHETFGERRLTR